MFGCVISERGKKNLSERSKSMDNGASSYRRFRDEGDESGLAEIIRDYRDGLIFYLNGFVNNIQVAEELAEDNPRTNVKGNYITAARRAIAHFTNLSIISIIDSEQRR